MCQSAERAGGELYLKRFDSGESTGIVLQCYCTTGSVGGRLQAQSGIHPFMWKLRPRVSYQSNHPLPSDRDCQAAAGHSQPAAACTDAAAYCRWLHAKTPSTSSIAQSLRGGGGDIYSFCTDRNSPEHARVDDFLSLVLSNLPGRQPARWCC